MTLVPDQSAHAPCGGRYGVMLALVAAGCVITGCASTQAVQTDVAATATAPVSGTVRSSAAEFADAKAAQSLVQAIDERLTLMRDVAAAKWLSGAPILDAAREAVVLQHVAVHARSLGLDPVTTQAFFAGQIGLARGLQQRWHDEWKQAGHCAPCDEPAGLQVVRERIDATNEQAVRRVVPVDAVA